MFRGHLSQTLRSRQTSLSFWEGIWKKKKKSALRETARQDLRRLPDNKRSRLKFVYSPTSGFKVEAFDCSGFSAEGTSVSDFAVLQEEGEREGEREIRLMFRCVHRDHTDY